MNSTDNFNTWNYLTDISFLNPKKSSLAENKILKRIQASTLGTFYDLAMIPLNATQALIKAPVSLIRAIIISIDPKKGDDFLKKWSGNAVAKHLYRSIALIIAVIINPFVSLISPSTALHLHLKFHLISGKHQKEKEQALNELLDDFKTKLATIKEKIPLEASVQEAANSLEEIKHLKNCFVAFKNENIPAAKLFCQAYEEVLNQLATHAHDHCIGVLEGERKKTQAEKHEIKINQLKERALQLESPSEVEEILGEAQSLKKQILQSIPNSPDIEKHINEALGSIELHNKKIRFLEGKITEAIHQFNSNPMRKQTPLLEENTEDRKKIRGRLEEIIRLKNEKLACKSLRKNPDHILQRKVAKGMLAIDLDVGLESIGKGQHGSLFVKSLNGKKLGVFKPDGEGQKSFMGNIISTTKLALGQTQRTLLNPGKYTYSCAEKAAYIIAQMLNCPYLNVSPVKILKTEKNQGAFLVFAKNMKEASLLKYELNAKKTYSHKELNIFQSFVLFDFLLGNMDRHLENFLIQWKGEEIRKIVPIDNANSLPVARPEIHNIAARRNLHAWKRLNLAKSPFTEEMKEFIKNQITPENIQKIIEAIDSDEEILHLYDNKPFLTPESKELLKKRADLMLDIIAKNHSTPVDLADAYY